MWPAKLGSKLLYETIAVSLFACIPMLRLLVACSIDAHLFWVLPKVGQRKARLLTVYSSIKKSREWPTRIPNTDLEFNISIWCQHHLCLKKIIISYSFTVSSALHGSFHLSNIKLELNMYYYKIPKIKPQGYTEGNLCYKIS